MIKVTASTGILHYKTQLKAGTNEIISDEPIEDDGQNLGFKPAELLSASLAACTSITLRMYADRKKWDLTEVIVDVDFETSLKDSHPHFTINIRLFGNLDETQREKLLEIANKCPIHKILSNPVSMETFLKE